MNSASLKNNLNIATGEKGKKTSSKKKTAGVGGGSPIRGCGERCEKCKQGRSILREEKVKIPEQS